MSDITGLTGYFRYGIKSEFLNYISTGEILPENLYYIDNEDGTFSLYIGENEIAFSILFYTSANPPKEFQDERIYINLTSKIMTVYYNGTALNMYMDTESNISTATDINKPVNVKAVREYVASSLDKIEYLEDDETHPNSLKITHADGKIDYITLMNYLKSISYDKNTGTFSYKDSTEKNTSFTLFDILQSTINGKGASMIGVSNSYSSNGKNVEAVLIDHDLYISKATESFTNIDKLIDEIDVSIEELNDDIILEMNTIEGLTKESNKKTIIADINRDGENIIPLLLPINTIIENVRLISDSADKFETLIQIGDYTLINGNVLITDDDSIYEKRLRIRLNKNFNSIYCNVSRTNNDKIFSNLTLEIDYYIDKRIYGKNLINVNGYSDRLYEDVISEVIDNKLHISSTASGIVGDTLNLIDKLESNTEYVLSLNHDEELNSSIMLQLTIVKNNGTIYESHQCMYGNSVSFTTPDFNEGSSAILVIELTGIVSDTILYPQLEKGNVATSYELFRVENI